MVTSTDCAQIAYLPTKQNHSASAHCPHGLFARCPASTDLLLLCGNGLSLTMKDDFRNSSLGRCMPVASGHLVLVVELDLEGILDGLGGVAVATVVGS